ncbi:MAG: YciI family protein [Pseudomonadota bacterium]|nr:YciI family protein [Pseudomonadota bacterium]
MRVMVMIKATKNSEAGAAPSEQLATEMTRFNEALVQAGVMLGGDGLKPTRLGKRVRLVGDERLVIDGPFAETKEVLAGYWVWQVKSMDEAVEWVRRCPHPMPGEDTDIEIRPLYEVEDFGDAFPPELREKERQMRAEIERQQSK